MEAQGLSVAYGRARALDGVDLRAEPGTVTAVIGPNGSGKSTLLKAIAGLAGATGRLSFAGRAVAAGQACRADDRLGYLPQEHESRALLRVIEVVLLGRIRALGLRVPLSELQAAGRVLDELGLGGLAQRYVTELSGGQRQMVYLAQVLAAEPAALLLDEPTGALDLRNQMEMLETVRRLTRQRGLTTLVAIHDLTAAVRCADRILVLDRGRAVAAGSAAEVLTPSLLAAVYRIEAAVSRGIDGQPSITALRALPLADAR
ncbi:MAG: ABC transporter ATP-binding protein [Alphaproteobacteria bacterium]|nr:ABC transporter ATP-binding protein [Alphaproteobacteria bacterium]